MSQTGDKKKKVKQFIQIGDLKLPTRITVKRLRRVKEMTGIDLTGQDTGPMLDFAINPITVVEVCMALYADHLEKAGLSDDDFDESCGPDEVELLREAVTDQMVSFSQFWRILSTEMESLRNGDTSQLIKKAQEAKKINEAASGLSS